MMRMLLIACVLCAFQCPHLLSQEVYIGMRVGVQIMPSTTLITDDMGIRTQGEDGSKFLEPWIHGSYSFHPLWQAGLGVSYRRETFSTSVWDPRADTCVLCPLRKGGGPSVREIWLNPSISRRIMSQHGLEVFLTTGMAWAIRFDVESNNGLDASSPFYQILEDLTSVYAINPIYLTLGADLVHRRWRGSFRYEYTSKYTGLATIEGNTYPIQASQSRLVLGISFRIWHNSS